ncbi:uncharacterized protein [Lolium perenne]|uniref:uncharacterized protein n=1 Tax=Lolium perenne TaxID=4522 RepID=UPI003A9979C3
MEVYARNSDGYKSFALMHCYTKLKGNEKWRLTRLSLSKGKDTIDLDEASAMSAGRPTGNKPPPAPVLPAAAAPVLLPMQVPALPPVLARLLNGGTAPDVAMSPFALLSTLTAGAMFSGQIAPVSGFTSPPLVSTVPAPTSLAPPTMAAPSPSTAPLPTPNAPPPSKIAAAAPPGFYFNPTPEHFNALALYQGLLHAGSSSTLSPSFEKSTSHGGFGPDPYVYGGAPFLGLTPAPAAATGAVPPGPPYAIAGAPAGGVAPFYIAHPIPVKLSPDNYLAWRAQVLPLLQSRHLEGFIDGSLPCPPSYHPAYHQWVAQDRAILSGIQSSLTESVSGLVLFATTSREAWAALDTSYSTQSIARSMAIRTQLGELKKNDLTVTLYFNKISVLADTLASIGQPLCPEEFISYVFNGLDDDYDSLVENITGRTIPIQPRELYARMLATEQRIVSRRSSPSYAAANAATRGGKPSKPYLPKSAPAPGDAAAPPPGSRPVITSLNGRPRACCATCGAFTACQLCGIDGHVASKCHRRFKAEFLGLGNNGKGNDKQAALATHGHTQSYSVDAPWYMDTGATNHLTSEMAKLNAHEPYQGHDHVRTANGAAVFVSLHHIGTLVWVTLPLLSFAMFSIAMSFPYWSRRTCATAGCPCFPACRFLVAGRRSRLLHEPCSSDCFSAPCVAFLASVRLVIAWAGVVWAGVLCYDALCVTCLVIAVCVPRLVIAGFPWVLCFLSTAWCFHHHVDCPCGVYLTTCCSAISTLDPTAEPRHFQAALGIPHWRAAMELEIQSLLQLDVQNAFLHGVLEEESLLQLDVQNAFLHGVLEEEAPRAWHARLAAVLRALGFVPSTADTSLFLLQRPEVTTYLLVYVDDIILVSSSVTAAMSASDHLSAFDGDPLSTEDATEYRSLVCQFLHAPTDSHWSAVKHILRYVRHTSVYGMAVRPTASCVLSAFSDADWAGSPDDRRSTEGYAVFLGSNLIAWRARKQATVSRSSTEAEYKAVADATTELIWVQSLLRELRISQCTSPILWCDNIGATYLPSNPVFHARTKHIEIDYHFVRERVAQKLLCIKFISSKDQLADIFTKPLPQPLFDGCRRNLNLLSSSSHN